MKFIADAVRGKVSKTGVRKVLKMFLESGGSGRHTPAGSTLAPLLTFCTENKLPYTLAFEGHGYTVELNIVPSPSRLSELLAKAKLFEPGRDPFARAIVKMFMEVPVFSMAMASQALDLASQGGKDRDATLAICAFLKELARLKASGAQP